MKNAGLVMPPVFACSMMGLDLNVSHVYVFWGLVFFAPASKCPCPSLLEFFPGLKIGPRSLG